MIRRFNEWFDGLPEPRRFVTAMCVGTSWIWIGWAAEFAAASGLTVLGEWLRVAAVLALAGVGIICFHRLERISK